MYFRYFAAICIVTTSIFAIAGVSYLLAGWVGPSILGAIVFIALIATFIKKMDDEWNSYLDTLD